MKFKSILVANRGEIACRVIRTARELGYRSIAVYSEADANAMHVRQADAAICIGPAPAAESYLDIDKVIQAAQQAGADAIHPGYGFLSENAAFAEACQEAGLTFIGPGSEAIELMGNKAAAKRRMEQVGVPCLPGYHGEDQGNEALTAAANDIGFPIMVKAAAGGGGRGMRLVEDVEGLSSALDLARSEALSAFGSDELILERAVIRPRHVEIQVLADTLGNTIHLGERDCSVQRRHQKIIEESPCPVMTPALRDAMGTAAVEAASSIGYVGAGTVEFLLADDGAFYFMEMNTRLQVEHPVTEMVTGLDLVARQIRVAEGEALELTQDDIGLDGHAIEVRLCAEDVPGGFLPSTGLVHGLVLPEGQGIRVDAGIAAGDEVTPFYDPMVAKIIAWGPDRKMALQRLLSALDGTALMGPSSNRDFLLDALGRQSFAGGEATTAFVGEEYPEAFEPRDNPVDSAAVAALLQYLAAAEAAMQKTVRVCSALGGWSSSIPAGTFYRYAHGDGHIDAKVVPTGQQACHVQVGEDTMEMVVAGSDQNAVSLMIDGSPARVLYVHADPCTIHMVLGTRSSSWTNVLGQPAVREDAASSGQVLAPMHGLVQEVLVATGEEVSPGDPLLVLEAMKMQHELKAGVSGVVSTVHCEAGKQVRADALLMEIES